MNEIDWDRLVVVTATHGEKLLGFIPEHITDPHKYIEDRTYEHGPIELKNARILLAQMHPSLDPRGRPVGVAKLFLPMTIDLAVGPVSSYFLVPSSWYFPGEDKVVKKRMTEVLRQAETNESQMAAEDAGIIAATSMPQKVSH